jgi:hypothetical protein
VGKRSRADVVQSAHEETALEHDPEVTTAKVRTKIDLLRVSYGEALGFENQTGNGTTSSSQLCFGLSLSGISVPSRNPTQPSNRVVTPIHR